MITGKQTDLDLDHDGFRSLLTFLRYSEGAAIAPAGFQRSGSGAGIP
jgi:hypothetical protein